MINACAVLSEKPTARPAREQEPLIEREGATAPTKVTEALGAERRVLEFCAGSFMGAIFCFRTH